MSRYVVLAKSLVKQTEPVVESAERVAEAVLDALRQHETVVLSMEEVRGASSSFYNVIIQRVAGEIGIIEAERRLEFQISSEAQRIVLGRSLASVKAAMQAPAPPAASACQHGD